MRKQILGPLAAVVGTVVLALSAVACSSGEGEEPSSGVVSEDQSSAAVSDLESGAESALPPVMVSIDDLADGEFVISSKQPLVVNVDDPQDWTGETTEPAIAEFIPGSDDGITVLNPGFRAVGLGTTTASITSPIGETYSFTIKVNE